MKKDAADHLRESGAEGVRARIDADIAKAKSKADEKAARANGKQTTPGPIGETFGAEGLKTMTFAPIKYVVPGIFVEGLILFAGKPKTGKSWLLLHAAIAVEPPAQNRAGRLHARRDSLHRRRRALLRARRQQAAATIAHDQTHRLAEAAVLPL